VDDFVFDINNGAEFTQIFDFYVRDLCFDILALASGSIDVVAEFGQFNPDVVCEHQLFVHEDHEKIHERVTLQFLDSIQFN